MEVRVVAFYGFSPSETFEFCFTCQGANGNIWTISYEIDIGGNTTVRVLETNVCITTSKQ